MFDDELYDNNIASDYAEPRNPYSDMNRPKNILVIGKKGEFLTESMVNDLKWRGFNALKTESDVTEISKIKEEVYLYVVIVEAVVEARPILVYLRDQVFDKQLHICLICHRGDDSQILGILPKEDIAQIYYRPVNLKEVGADLERIYKRTKGEAKKKSILLIDDDAVFLKRTAGVLKGKGDFKVYMVTSGASAVLLMAKHHVDLILLDYEMPIIDGPKVYQMIKAEPDLSGIPIMFLSGHADVESVKTAVQLKPERYISKTLKAEDFVKLIKEFFQDARFYV